MIGLALSMPLDPGLKCPRTHSLPGFSEDDVAALIDGQLQKISPGENVMDDIDPSEVDRLEVTCWDPETDEIPARRGVPLVIVVTKQGLANAESAMLRAVKSVRSFVSERAELPSSIDVLDPSFSGYTIRGRDGAWTLTSTALGGHVCTATPVHIAEGRAHCEDIHSAPKRALREAWASR